MKRIARTMDHEIPIANLLDGSFAPLAIGILLATPNIQRFPEQHEVIQDGRIITVGNYNGFMVGQLQPRGNSLGVTAAAGVVRLIGFLIVALAAKVARRQSRRRAAWSRRVT